MFSLLGQLLSNRLLFFSAPPYRPIHKDCIDNGLLLFPATSYFRQPPSVKPFTEENRYRSMTFHLSACGTPKR